MSAKANRPVPHGGNNMKNGQIILIIIFYVIFITPSIYSFANNTSDMPANFKIIFWDTNLIKNPDILEEIKGISYQQFIVNKKIELRRILPDDNIIKYHWDDQLIEIDLINWEKYLTEKKFNKYGFFFTIVLNEKIIYHGFNGLNHPLLWPEQIRKILLKYNESDYPSINAIGINNESTISLWALNPRSGVYLHFREYDKKEQEKILNKEVFEYFEKKGKIVRGNLDLKLFGISETTVINP